MSYTRVEKSSSTKTSQNGAKIATSSEHWLAAIVVEEFFV
jgi:hypothetical protein